MRQNRRREVVITGVGSPQKIDAVRTLHADEMFVYANVPPPQAAAEPARGERFDVVLDNGRTLVRRTPQMPVPRGMASPAWSPGWRTTEIDLIELFVRRLRILRFRVASPNDIRTALRLCDQRVIVPPARTLPLPKAAEANARLGRRQHVGTVVLVRP